MKIGVSIKIDVTKIDKARLFKGEKGTYLDLTTFIDTDNPPGPYGDHGMITQDVSKQEKDQGIKGPILGNVKVFWNEQSQQAHAGGMQQTRQAMQQAPPQQQAPQQQQQAPPQQQAPQQQQPQYQQQAPAPQQQPVDDFIDDDIPF